ncbi:2-hydroxyisoflavanone dehydratase [Ricinus communis]|uniref:Catalytic, putative n=1 Tax=Ricinus communis TaxID=3988 RepID=B9RTY7_RICCO|nr:2-hydroxyisoflavanone dehydratase [Ricinus communis]EEF45369.1 catalytic, putative [Ricinus communis]|eukprot:XP_002517206.1 2-hydroxyisoflavanone dehydratase [Ricinus communis]
MDSVAKEVESELLPFLRVYKDGSVERLIGSPIVPASIEDPETGVSSKDITISQDPPISARLYLPKFTEPNQKLAVLFYCHGGGFCIESAFSLTETKYMNSLVSLAKVVAISVEYRLAPEHPLSVVYEDCWVALQWVAMHSDKNELENKDPWIFNHGDFSRLFIGGDSAGANIAHNMVMKVGSEGLKSDIKLLGAYLTHPYFWGSKAVGSESTIEREQHLPYRVWSFLYPSAPGGIDNSMINPVAPGAPSLAGLGGSRLLISVAEKDELRERGILYYNVVKESGWKGEIQLIEVEGEDHAFHILNFETEKAKNLIKRLASFLLN